MNKNYEEFVASIVKDVVYIARYGVGGFTVNMSHYEHPQSLASYLTDEQLEQVKIWAIDNLKYLKKTIDEVGNCVE